MVTEPSPSVEDTAATMICAECFNAIAAQMLYVIACKGNRLKYKERM